MRGRPKKPNELTHADRVPAGILFGDIKGSTDAAEKDEIGTVQTTRQYISLVESAVKSFSPRFFKVKTEGDGFLARFANAHVMVECGMALQTVFRERGWKVRLGGHHAEAFENTGGDLLGADMNRAARIASAADGDLCQFLVSDVVPTVVRDRLAEIAFEDHGVVQAKGVEQGLRTYEVVRCGEFGHRERQREAYLADLAKTHQWIDLGGLAPQVGTELLRIPLDDVFVHLFVQQDTPKLDHYEREEIRYRRDFGGDADLHGRERSLLAAAERFDARYHKKQEQPSQRVAVAALAEYARSVVLGDPGSGKTTLLRYLARRVALRKALNGTDAPLTGVWENRTPIYLRVGDFAAHLDEHPGATLDEFIQGGAGVSAVTIARDLFRLEKARGRCLFLFDGLDEIADTKLRQKVRDHVRGFMADNAMCASVVTSRIVGYRDAPLPGGESDFAHFTLCPFDDDEIGRFLVRWYEAIANTGQITDTERQNAHVLADSIRKHVSVRRLATNPLLLTLIAIIYWRETKLPRRRIELYRSAATMLLEKWRQAGLDVRESTSILMAIAFEMHATSGVGLITRPELERLVIALKMDPKRGGRAQLDAERESEQFLKRIAEQSGLLYARGVDERGMEVFGFLHLTFEEYFAAREFARRWKQQHLCLEDYLHLPRWREILLLASAHLSDEDDEQASDAFVRRILEAHSPYEAQLHRDLLLAVHCLADDAVVYKDLREDVFARIDAALGSPIRPLNRLIADALSAMAGSRVEVLAMNLAFTKLSHGADSVRVAAASTLGAMGKSAGTTEVLTALVELLRDEEQNVQNEAASALGAMGEKISAAPEFIHALLALLRDEKWTIRQAAAHAIAAMGEHAATQEILSFLVELLRREIGEEFHMALNALALMGKIAATPDYIAAVRPLLHDEDREVRLAAMNVVCNIDARAMPELSSVLVGLLRDDYSTVRWLAVSAVQKIGQRMATPEVLLALVGLLRDDDIEVPLHVAHTLRAMREALTPEVLTALVELLRDEDKKVRYAAENAIKEIGKIAATPEIVSALAGLLGDGDGRVRSYAAMALGAMGASAATSEILRALLKLMHDEDDDDWHFAAPSALRELGKIGTATPEFLPGVVVLMRDESANVRDSAAYVVDAIGASAATPEVLSALAALLRDKYWRVRCRAAYAVRAMGARAATAEFLGALAELLGDDVGYVREGAAIALRAMGQRAATPEVIRALIGAVRDGKGSSRSDAAQALGAMGDIAVKAEILTEIERYLRDQDGEERSSAAIAMAKMGEIAATPEILSVLSELLHDVVAHVREMTAISVGAMGEVASTPEVLTALAELIDETCRASTGTSSSAANEAFRSLMVLAPFERWSSTVPRLGALT